MTNYFAAGQGGCCVFVLAGSSGRAKRASGQRRLLEREDSP